MSVKLHYFDFQASSSSFNHAFEVPTHVNFSLIRNWRDTKDLLVPDNGAKNLIGASVLYEIIRLCAQVHASPQVIK